MVISTGKKSISRREKIGKSDFAPPPNIPLTPLLTGVTEKRVPEIERPSAHRTCVK